MDFSIFPKKRKIAEEVGGLLGHFGVQEFCDFLKNLENKYPRKCQ